MRTFILMTFGDGFEQSDDPPRPAGLPDAASSSATLWNHRESQLVDAREAERVVFQWWQDFHREVGAVREVANLVPRVRAEHHPPHWPRRVTRVITRSSGLSERRFSSRLEAEELVHMNGDGRPPWPLAGAAGLFLP